MSPDESDLAPETPRQPEAALAVVAIVCGLGGLLVVLASPPVGMVAGAFGVTCGWRGRQGNVRHQLALAGIVLGALAVVIGVVLILTGPITPPGMPEPQGG